MTNDELILRRQQLLVRSAELRIAFSSQIQVLQKPLALADSARDGLQWLQRNPQWPLAALVVIFVVRPRAAWRWGGRLWWAWKTYHQARKLLMSVPASPAPSVS